MVSIESEDAPLSIPCIASKTEPRYVSPLREFQYALTVTWTEFQFHLFILAAYIHQIVYIALNFCILADTEIC